MEDRERLIELIGQAALEADPGAFVRARCHDPREQGVALGLLDALRKAGGFLQGPPFSGFEKENGGAMIGRRVGRYTLLSLIGEGGFGHVFLAAQHEPVQRQVALKVIRSGMDSQSVVARFEAER
jgi:hypothetical protein